jgi:hypothetical protein
MKMQRHFFISDDLDDLERFEEQLEAGGVWRPQVHVLSAKVADATEHAHLNCVRSMMRSDIIHSTTRGALIGLAAAAAVLLVAYFAGWTGTAAGWVPFGFLAVLVLGFCTWEGGLSGIQRPNHFFTRFDQALKDGRHVFFVDLAPGQEPVLQKVLADHPAVEPAGTCKSAQHHWILAVQQKFDTVRHAL